MVPEPSTPSDGAILEYPAEPPLFRWNGADGATSYRVEIDDAPDFIGAGIYTTTNRSFTLVEPQTVGQPFYWHVKANFADGTTTDWSATRSYSISWSEAPELVAPANTTSTTVEDVAFVWEPVLGAATYQIQVSPNGDWTNNLPIDVVVKGTRYSPPATLNNASYFWRVRARDAALTPNLGPWSEEWQFSRGWLRTPILLTPPDQDAFVTTPTFSWAPVEHASHYEIQLGGDANFSPGTYGNCYTNHTSFTYYDVQLVRPPNPPGSCSTVFQLDPGDTFYWRVRGIDSPLLGSSTGGVNGLWSAVSRLTYRPGIPATLSPASGASVSTPSLQWGAVEGATKYQVTILKSNGNVVQTEDTAATSFTPTVKLNAADGPFSWYVQSIDLFGHKGLIPNAASWKTFSLVSATAGSTTQLLTPADGSSSVRMPAMTWEPVAGADYYKVFYSLQGTGTEALLSETIKLQHPGFTYAVEVLPTGTYEWRIEAYNNTAGFLTGSSSRSFRIRALESPVLVGPDECLPNVACPDLTDTPTLDWDPAAGAGSYLVYLALDPDFTNIVKAYRTQYTQLTPRESLFDNQAGQAYYWLVVPCKTPTRCGPFDSSVYPDAYAFRKRSRPIALLSPTDGATVPDQVTFHWQDFLQRNQSSSPPVTQEARQYRIQVSTVADFAKILDDKIVDQTTYTPFDKTYPEGQLYWRVAAIDGSSNLLTFSPPWSITKQSPKLNLNFPAADVTFAGEGVPYFQWTPQDYAAKYEVEVYRNGDLNFSPTNKALLQQTKMAAWAPTGELARGTYAWRVRRLDADAKPGPWSQGRRFTLDTNPTNTTLQVARLARKVRASGSLDPAHPGRVMAVTLSKRSSGTFVKVAQASATLSASSNYVATFARPSRGRCKIVARFAGDSDHLPSQKTVGFRC